VTYLAWLEAAAGAQLARGAVGKVVFVRAFLQITADHGLLAPVAAAQVETAARWAGSEVARVYTQGGERRGFVSVLAELADGQTALVSAELTHGADASAELLIVGQRGTLRFQDQPEPERLLELAPAAGRALAGALARSLQSGRPAQVK
jgi:hypothetical protein